MHVPEADFALIGGSSTLSINVPENLRLNSVEILAANMVFDTPFGPSPEFKYLSIDNVGGPKTVLTCKMHGWRQGVSRSNASRQIFWVFKQAGIKRVLVEGGVGAINHLLRTRDVVVPHDYIDVSMRKDIGLEDRYLLVMREALCPQIRRQLIDVCEEQWSGRVFDRSIYVNTDGRHFESPAEVMMYKQAGGDIIGQSITPEVYLAREIGACYAGVYLVVNFAEGIVQPWTHQELADIYYGESKSLAKILFETLRRLPMEFTCGCRNLRKETLLKDIYEREEANGQEFKQRYD
ncbi:MAG: MTAP family purine nucleoside phosphorylase [Bacillota bacterium]|nr:MTAP family purine nucleoside phosphorylase [Bacillota bacterium]